MRAYGHDTDGVTAIPEEGRWLHAAAQRVLTGEHTLASVAEWMTESAGLTVFGRPWSATTLRRRLLNPAVAGLRRNAEGELVPGPAEKLIEPETFAQLEEFFAPKKRGEGAAQQTHYLTGGPGMCALCENPLVSRATGNVSRTHGYVCETTGCGKIRISAGPLDAYVAERALARLSRPSSLKRLAERKEQIAKEAKAASELLTELTEHRKDLAAAYGAREMNLAEFRAAKEAAEEQRLGALAVVRRGRLLDELPPLTLEGIVEWWNETAGPEQQKALLQLVVKQVTVGPATVPGSRTFDEDRFSIRYW